MPTTGQRCETTGIYKCSVHGNTINIQKGDTFPPCQAPGSDPDHGATWILVSSK